MVCKSVVCRAGPCLLWGTFLPRQLQGQSPRDRGIDAAHHSVSKRLAYREKCAAKENRRVTKDKKKMSPNKVQHGICFKLTSNPQIMSVRDYKELIIL